MYKTNADLKKKYDNVYNAGRDKFFTRFKNGQDLSEVDQTILDYCQWEGKIVCDVGCGVGQLAAKIALAGAKSVIGFDYIPKAIELARGAHREIKNLSFESKEAFEDYGQKFDIIVSSGTIEHFDSPELFLNHTKQFLNKDGTLILTCPHFLNIRGIVYMTLHTLLDVPMSLTDLHYIHPFHMQKWAQESSFEIIEIKSFDYELGNGQLMCDDFQKRLTNALRDAKLPNDKVPEMVSYLEKFTQYLKQNYSENPPLEGASCLYALKKGKR